MLFFPRGRGSDASDDSDDYQPLARGLLWDGNNLRTDTILPPPSLPTHHNPITSYDGLGLDPDDVQEDDNDDSGSGCDFGGDDGLDWDQNSITDDVPPLTEECWYQLTDMYGVEFAINRFMDPHNSLRDRARVANEIIGLLALVGEWAEKGLRLVNVYVRADALRQRGFWDNPMVALSFYGRQPERGLTGEGLLKSIFRKSVQRTVDHHMSRAWKFTERSKIAIEMILLWDKMTAYVNQGTTYIWEKIIAPENLWDDCGGEDQLKGKVGYDEVAIRNWRSSLEDFDRYHATLNRLWGVGWEKKLDPTRRWVPQGSNEFLLQLATMAGSWRMDELRDILDFST